ncbi:MAG: response regulator [Anaerolineae bacterium]|jgi:AmiR/NasT family two-component response regulator
MANFQPLSHDQQPTPSMAQPLCIVIADDEAVIRLGLQAMLEALGHQVVGMAADGELALTLITDHKPDLAILDIKMPGLDGLTVAERLAQESPLPVVILTAYSQQALVERAVGASVTGYLVKPVREELLGPTVELAVARFQALEAIRNEVDDLRQQLAARRTVDKAKRLLMMRTGWSEAEAYRRLQMAGRQTRRSMQSVAEVVIASDGDPSSLVY